MAEDLLKKETDDMEELLVLLLVLAQYKLLRMR